ncbi:MAG: LD-carboxypeptidase [Nitrospinae bacterium]|nr:LD-carboxypeptidase [Nitrospinota bacterium]
MSKKSRSLIRPVKLNPGDSVGVVAPAGPVDKTRLQKGLNVISEMGFEPVLGKYVYSRSRFLAGTDSQRAKDIMDMVRNPAIKAIFCARGGYGANRILEHLDAKVIRAHPKIFVGSSDITLLLHYLYLQCGVVGFHGPMVAGSFGRAPMRQSREQFKNILMGKPSSLYCRKAKVFSKGSATGKITGGCLTLLCRSLGTPYEIQTRNRILFIEDVSEPLYKLDGMLWQLKAAGKFKGVRGIVFGEMVNCNPQKPGDGKLVDELGDLFPKPDIPILTHCPIGHSKEIWTLPFETQATLDTSAKSLELKNCGVK